jgi:NAD(P)-dependent dehydrogenase (short-subunit alcohol dehydrogenase family)
MALASNLDPKGRVVLVSGANRGIGLAIANRLYDEGYTLSLGVRRPEGMADWIRARDGTRVAAFAFEARDVEAPRRWVEASHARFGRVDAVVNNAGIVRRFPFDAPDEALLDEMWEVNLKAPYRLIVAALPHLRASGAGRIVNLVSLAGLRYGGGSPGYALVKHATQALTQIARQFAWKDGVRATAICPGSTDTDFIADARPAPREALTKPEDVAGLVALALALPNTASIATIPVNWTAEATL